MTNATELRLSTIHQIAQSVIDLARAIAFYRDTLGATLIPKFDPPGLACFDLDGTRLMLQAPAGSDHPGSTIYFRVADIQRAAARLRSRGATFERDLHLVNRDDDSLIGPAGGEERMAFCRDPGGNLLAITARVDARS